MGVCNILEVTLVQGVLPPRTTWSGPWSVLVTYLDDWVALVGNNVDHVVE